jgi:hypothetical protein
LLRLRWLATFRPGRLRWWTQWPRCARIDFGSSSGCNAAQPAQQFQERYSYTKGGLVEKKRLTVTANVNPNGYTAQSVNLDTAQTYDNEGKVLTVADSGEGEH